MVSKVSLEHGRWYHVGATFDGVHQSLMVTEATTLATATSAPSSSSSLSSSSSTTSEGVTVVTGAIETVDVLTLPSVGKSKHRRRALIASNRSISGEGGDLAIGGNDFVGHVADLAVFDTRLTRSQLRKAYKFGSFSPVDLISSSSSSSSSDGTYGSGCYCSKHE